MFDIEELFAPILLSIDRSLPISDVLSACRESKGNGLFAVEAINLLNEHKRDLFVTSEQMSLIDTLITCLRGGGEKLEDLSDNPMQVLSYIAMITDRFKYHKLSKKLSERSRKIYEATLPEWCNFDGDDIKIVTANGLLITNGYERIVIGDYGAYIEFDRSQAVRENICVKQGQEYRYKDPTFLNTVKFYWYTSKCGSDIKIYFQQKEVTYADYKQKKLYISPFECSPAKC